ncbi:AraC family transcriptional regulator [Ktedonobacter sp. SOSP1-52]|uniref:helix-turn-helix domain-containing protein n=1 Tax=Ktedonobacter sp. SOSP1-52 TaxID=2778366 RepID=UPI0019161784|nr:AraC family transcriptional regulator [Ktedonobacter sp. SOSP1-52]GHO61166.1 AraC family transcriptional regulator [Ktedonobacter sp. SOSP1-52]
MDKKSLVPRSTSTRAFENYVMTVPILSSWERGWDGVMVREYDHMPDQVEWVRIPTVPDIHLALVQQGAVYIESRDEHAPVEALHVQKGDLFLTPGGGVPYELHWHSLSSEPLQSLHVHLSADLFVRAAEQVTDADPTRLELSVLSGFQDPLLAQMALALQQELEQPTSYGRLYADTAAQMLAVHLLKHYLTTTLRVRQTPPGLTSRQMRQVMDYLLTHLHEQLSLETLAQQVGFSAYHFAILFRQTTGETPHQFVLSKRLEEAQRLLRETDLPLSQVALSVGFQSQSHFTHVFRNRLGETPRHYRQNHERSTHFPAFSTKFPEM